MRVISWNVRGMSLELKLESVKKLISSSRVSVCFIQETKLVSVLTTSVRKIWRMIILILEVRMQLKGLLGC